jgi:hypothetical protein
LDFDGEVKLGDKCYQFLMLFPSP